MTRVVTQILGSDFPYVGPPTFSSIYIRTLLYLQNNNVTTTINVLMGHIILPALATDYVIVINWPFNVSIPTLTDLQSITDQDITDYYFKQNFKAPTVPIHTTAELSLITDVPNGTIAFNTDLNKGVIFFNGTWN